MVKEEDILNFNFFVYKGILTGSSKDFRYRIKKDAVKKGEEEEETVLRVWCWKGLYCFEKTPEEEIRVKDFSFDEEGRKQAILWLNEMEKEIK